MLLNCVLKSYRMELIASQVSSFVTGIIVGEWYLAASDRET